MPMTDTKKWIEVVCAIIESNHGILCVQRSSKMTLPLKWEFPGGKLVAGEKETIAVIREIKEELNIEISIIKRLTPNYHTYQNGINIKLIPFHCKIIAGLIELIEHSEYKWLPPKSLKNLDWAEADIPIVKQIETLEL